MSKGRLNRISVAGLLMLAAGLHLYGWFAVELSTIYLPFEGVCTFNYLLIFSGVIFILNSLRRRNKTHIDLLYILGLVGAIMSLAAMFTALVYTYKHGLHCHGGHGIICEIKLLIELNTPIAPLVSALYFGGLSMMIAYTSIYWLIKIYK